MDARDDAMHHVVQEGPDDQDDDGRPRTTEGPEL